MVRLVKAATWIMDPKSVSAITIAEVAKTEFSGFETLILERDSGRSPFRAIANAVLEAASRSARSTLRVATAAPRTTSATSHGSPRTEAASAIGEALFENCAA